MSSIAINAWGETSFLLHYYRLFFNNNCTYSCVIQVATIMMNFFLVAFYVTW